MQVPYKDAWDITTNGPCNIPGSDPGGGDQGELKPPPPNLMRCVSILVVLCWYPNIKSTTQALPCSDQSSIFLALDLTCYNP